MTKFEVKIIPLFPNTNGSFVKELKSPSFTL